MILSHKGLSKKKKAVFLDSPFYSLIMRVSRGIRATCAGWRGAAGG